MGFFEKLKAFLKDESGQTTTEYFLILAVVATILMQFRKKLFGVIEKLVDGVAKNADKALENLDGGPG